MKFSKYYTSLCRRINWSRWNGLSSQSLVVLSLISVMSLSCTSDQPNIEVFQDMFESPAIKAQDFDSKRPGEMANRMPPAGTQAIGHIPYKYTGKPEDAERLLINEIPGENLEQGKHLYETYCFVCHGSLGDGKGPVAAKFLVPVPSLLTDKVINFKDGRIFHIITDGQGVMNSYDSQVKSPIDRWAIVNYIRTLQRK